MNKEQIIEGFKQWDIESDDNSLYSVALVGCYEDGHFTTHTTTACHAMFTDGPRGVSGYEAICNKICYYPQALTKECIKTSIDLVELLLDKEHSPYKKLLDFLGDDLTVIRRNGRPTCFILTNMRVNNKVFMNFCKAFRSVGEHQITLKFYQKWGLGKSPREKRLAWFMSQVFLSSGDLSVRTHNVFSSETYKEMNLKSLMEPETHDWSLGTDTIADGRGYTGEAAYVWYGRTNLLKLPRFGKKQLITRFVKLYEKTDADGYTTKDLKKIFDLAKKGELA